ncbi:hypothetical protein [Rubrivirga sp. IMCC43871]|uniref:hypothetical protein n=1 Tax=Rubrivirga sp. IMCC43871 TaxID=3391575 RepID=UPI003990114D
MPLRLSLLALAAVVLLGACDSDPYYEDTSLRVFVTDFHFDADDYDVSSDFFTATFDAREAIVDRGDLDDALATAGDGALVMLYIDFELVSPLEGASGNRTYSALPLSRSFREVVINDQDGSGNSTVSVVGLTASYEYSFDNQDLYFDIVSSEPSSDFADSPRGLFDFLKPQRLPGESSDIDLRLVVIPQDLYYANAQAGARIDLRDYAAVKAAYNLPD